MLHPLESHLLIQQAGIKSASSCHFVASKETECAQLSQHISLCDSCIAAVKPYPVLDCDSNEAVVVRVKQRGLVLLSRACTIASPVNPDIDGQSLTCVAGRPDIELFYGSWSITSLRHQTLKDDEAYKETVLARSGVVYFTDATNTRSALRALRRVARSINCRVAIGFRSARRLPSEVTSRRFRIADAIVDV